MNNQEQSISIADHTPEKTNDPFDTGRIVHRYDFVSVYLPIEDLWLYTNQG